MDFVVFGFGLGAILMLVGFALRDLGPWLFGSARDEQALPEFESARTTIRKQTLSSIGNAISVAGAGVAVVTFAALLAKAEDDLGAIVVGMSLVLATVGVGAWTYDIFRRYRVAMDIVAVQEQAVRQRMAPRSPRRPKPETARQRTHQPAMPASSGAQAISKEPAEPLAAEPIPSNENVSADPFEEEAADQPESAAVSKADVTRDIATVEAADRSDLPGLEDGEPADVRDDAGGFDFEAEYHPERRHTSVPPVSVVDERQVELPPLPEEPDDTLIDEAVRLEPRSEPTRAVPSWLFEDLESDLGVTGPTRTDDPIDQFHDAAPLARSSALDRLLANEEAKGKADEDTASDRFRRRPSNRPASRDED